MKTETKHTQGPWEIETKGSRHFIDGADQLTVAYVDRAGVRDRQEIEANARLIAAAPELLAALIGMMNRYGDKSPHPTCDASISARAAISKAECNA